VPTALTVTTVGTAVRVRLDDDAAGVRALAALIMDAPPRAGRSRVVAVDGFAGAGKTTLAGSLADALTELTGVRPAVLHLDDLASHVDFFGWDTLLRRDVLEPLRQGRPGGYAAYDWRARAFGAARIVVPPVPVLLLDGVGAGRAALRPYLTLTVWLDVTRAAATAAGTRRDGPEQAAFWRDWLAAQDAFFAADPVWRHADVLVTRRLVPGAGGSPERRGTEGDGATHVTR
jgi:hypothetical protein